MFRSGHIGLGLGRGRLSQRTARPFVNRRKRFRFKSRPRYNNVRRIKRFRNALSVPKHGARYVLSRRMSSNYIKK